MSEQRETTCPDCGTEITYTENFKSWITFVKCPECGFEIDVDLYDNRD